MKNYHYLAIVALLPIIFWLTPNLVTKINHSNEFDNIELFDNGTACATYNEELVYFKAFPKAEDANHFWADSLCTTLRERNTFDDLSNNIQNRIEMWKLLFS